MKLKSLATAIVIAFSALGANATTYSFASFTLDVDLSSFAGTSITQTTDGFSFAGYNIGAVGVSNLIDFTITANNGYSFSSMSFTDAGSFTGTDGKFKVGDSFSDISVTATKASHTWNFSGTSLAATGSIAYDLKSANTYASASTGGNFSVVTTPVPEPESYAMLLAGLGLMGAIARRRNKSNAG